MKNMNAGTAEKGGMRLVRRRAVKMAREAAVGLGFLALVSCSRNDRTTAFGLERKTDMIASLQLEQDCIRQVNIAHGRYAFCPGSWPGNQEMERRISGMDAMRRRELYREDESRINSELGKLGMCLRKADWRYLGKEIRKVKREDYGTGRALAIEELESEIYNRRSFAVQLANLVFSDRNIETAEVLGIISLLLFMFSRKR